MSSMLIISALLMGLFGGAHCVVMCGGVVGVLCSGLSVEARSSTRRQLPYLVAYNGGRIASYTAFGAVAGAIGMLADRVDGFYEMQLGLRVFAGALMLGVGLYLAGAWRRFGSVEKLGAPLWHVIQSLARRALPVRSPAGALLLGLLWGWLPCGLVYAALATAVGTGSPARGALAMAAFGVGTLPALLLMGTLAGALSRFARRPWVKRAAGVAIAGFGLVNIAGAASQSGWLRVAAVVSHECCVHPARGFRVDPQR